MTPGGRGARYHQPGAAAALLLVASTSLVACASVPKFKPDRIGLPALIQDASAAAPAAAGSLAGPGHPPYRLGPQDQITVAIWGRPDLGSQVAEEHNRERKVSLVGHDGTVGMPLLGRVPVAGLTLAEAAAELEKRYAPFVSNPHVEVQLSASPSQLVYVFGEVVHQGTYAIPEKGLNILEALAAAGGPNPETAKNHSIFLLRPRKDGPRATTVYRLTLGELLEGGEVRLSTGDRLFVPPTVAASFERIWPVFIVPAGIVVSIISLIISLQQP